MVAELDLYLKRRELEIEQRLARVRKDNGILGYCPHTKQELFHSAGIFHFRYARTGNRFGKSEMGAAEDVAFALGYRPWYAVGDPRRTAGIPKHATKGVICTTNWNKAREIFTENSEGAAGLGKLFKYIPKDSIVGTPRKNHMGHIETIFIRHISGDVSSITILTIVSWKQDPLTAESSFWDWAHIDEPIPELMFKAIVRGFVDRGGKAWFTCTPLSEPWIDAAFSPSDEEEQRSDNVIAGAMSKDRWMMVGSISDNPHNTPEDIERTMAWYTEDEQDCRRNGLPASYAGLIYKECKPEKHFIRTRPAGWSGSDDFWIPPKDHTIRFAIDYHFRKNDAVLFIATEPSGHSIVFHEIWRQALLEDEVKEIKQVGYTLPGLVDPLAQTPNKVNDMTAMDHIIQLGLPVMPATKDPVNGIRFVKSHLRTVDKDGVPMLRFANHLRRTRFEILRGYIWKDDQNKPLDKNNDMMENLYRLCLHGLDYIEPSSDADYAPIASRDDFSNVVDAREFLREPKPERPHYDTETRYRR